jgi:branched-chain amino acid transport system permease protein
MSAEAKRRWKMQHTPLQSRIAVFALLAVIPPLAYATGQSFWIAIEARAAIFAIAAVSLAFILLQGGLVSFGHAAPFGIGAYAALLTGEAGITNLLAVLVAALLGGAAFSAATGALALRTRGIYFIMITLAFAQMAFFALSSLPALGGDDGMALRSKATFFGLPILRNEPMLAVLAALLLLGVLYGFERVSASRFGKVFRASSENEARVAALGFNPYSYRLAAYTIAGGAAGMSGALLANETEFVSPSVMNWHQSGEFIVMAILGTALGLPGAIVGAVAFVIFQEALSGVTENWQLFLGLFLILATLAPGLRLSDNLKRP